MQLSILLALSFLAQPMLIQAESWKIEPDQSWQVQGEIQEPEDLSGIVQLNAKTLLVVSDETRGAQLVDLDAAAHILKAGSAFTLLPGGKKELDLEAATVSTSGQWCYITGSHSVSRKKGEVQPDRKHVFRIPLRDGNLQLESIAQTTLTPVIEVLPLLRSALDKPSEDGGLDIEGLTEQDGKLFFGLRSPNMDDKAIIVEVEAEQLFTNPAQTQAKTHSLALGRNVGIRDMARLKEGYLFLVGPALSVSKNADYGLYFWAGPGSTPNLVGLLPPTKGKPEGLLVLAETAQRVNILILQDSTEKGQPLGLSLVRQ